MKQNIPLKGKKKKNDRRKQVYGKFYNKGSADENK
jgi:hypothetical protein